MDKPNMGMPAALAIITGIFTLGGLLSVGLLRKSVGVVLIMLVGIYGISQLKGDFFGVIKNFSEKSEASEIRRIELERERMKLEAETKLKVLEMETKRVDAERRAKEAERVRLEKQAAAEAKQAAADAARLEADRVRQEKVAEENAKRESEEKVSRAKQLALSGGFRLFEKTPNREIHFKLTPVKWVNGSKVITADVVLSRTELTTSSNGMKWQSERYNLEIMCGSTVSRFVNSVVYSGPWHTGDTLMMSNRATDWLEQRDWHRAFANKYCEDFPS